MSSADPNVTPQIQVVVGNQISGTNVKHNRCVGSQSASEIVELFAYEWSGTDVHHLALGAKNSCIDAHQIRMVVGWAGIAGSGKREPCEVLLLTVIGRA
jgi:hypothetical protein